MEDNQEKLRGKQSAWHKDVKEEIFGDEDDIQPSLLPSLESLEPNPRSFHNGFTSSTIAQNDVRFIQNRARTGNLYIKFPKTSSLC